MISKKKLLLNTNLYLIVNITDYKQLSLLYARAQKALKAGIKILQLRCKGLEDCTFYNLALRFRELTRRGSSLFILNERVDIAFNCNADGVHLGQNDLPLACARNILGKNKIIGKSTHNLNRLCRPSQKERIILVLARFLKQKLNRMQMHSGPMR